jgi:OFA family oxalate/formate antiporter-like MFS transporter
MNSREINQPSGTAPKFFYGYVVVAVAFIVMVSSWGLYLIYGVFFDPLLVEFGWTRAVISGAYSLSSILSGVLAIAMGGLTDRFGPRLVVTFCGFCLGLGYLLMSQVNAIWQLYLFYGVVVGIGMSGLWVPLLSSVARWFSMRRSLMTGIVISGLAVGQLAGPMIVSRLIAAHGWRLSYVILGGAVMLINVLFAQFLRRDPGQTGQVAAFGNEAAKQDFNSGSKDFSLKEAAHTPQFWLVAVIFFCAGFVAFAILVHIIPHATNLGISPIVAANILAINGGISIIGNFVLGGIIGDRIGNRKAFLAGIFLATVSLFWLVFARELWVLYLFAIVFGLALGSMGTSESPLIARLFGLSSHGLIYGVVGLSWTVGGALGPIVVGYMCDVFGNYQLAFLLCGVIGVLGLVLLAILRPTGRRGIGL